MPPAEQPVMRTARMIIVLQYSDKASAVCVRLRSLDGRGSVNLKNDGCRLTRLRVLLSKEGVTFVRTAFGWHQGRDLSRGFHAD